MGKYAVILHAMPNDSGRATHGLLYTKDLHEAGHEVILIFDGAGTTWIREYSKPEHKRHALFEELKRLGLIAGACEYCAVSFEVYDEVEAADISFLGEYEGHPSISELIADGYTILTL
ncbi:MAG: DsrE family protein [Candidatus Bipolaricaulia bacterium]